MEPISEEEMSELADCITPLIQERIALLLGMEGEVVANLRGEHRENVHGVSLGILKRWRNKNHQPGNRIVSERVQCFTLKKLYATKDANNFSPVRVEQFFLPK